MTRFWIAQRNDEELNSAGLAFAEEVCKDDAMSGNLKMYEPMMHQMIQKTNLACQTDPPLGRSNGRAMDFEFVSLFIERCGGFSSPEE